MRAVLSSLIQRLRRPAGGEPPRRDLAVVRGIARATVWLLGIELVGAWAMRWLHGGGYTSLVLLLTVLFSGVVAAAAWGMALEARLGLAFWAVLVAGTVEGPVTGFALALGIAVGAPWIRRLPLAYLATLAAGCLAGGSLGTTWLAGPLGFDAGAGGLAPALAFVTGFALVAAAGRELYRRLTTRLTPRRTTAVLAASLLLLAAEPVLHRPGGRRRLPKEPDLAAAKPEAADRPHVFLFVLDTVRADHLSVYGHYRDTTPNLVRWIEKRPNAVVYPSAYASGTWTVPSHASLFTGLAPSEHGAHFSLEGGSRFRFALREDAKTLATAMRESGYATLGVFANNWLRMVGGMGRGFDRYFRSHHAEPWPFLGESLRARLLPGAYADVVKGGARADQVNADLLSMVEPWSEGERPLFCFANFGDAHGPYAAPPGYRGKFRSTAWGVKPGHLSIHDSPERIEEQRTRYDEEILYLDAKLGELLDDLDRRGILADSWVFVTSDHGEAFGEHGVTEHGTGVFDEIVRVPLIVFPPDGVEIDTAFEPVGLVDVAATIAAIGGTPLPGAGLDLRVPYVPRGTKIEFYGDPWKAELHGELAARPARVVARRRYKLIAVGEELLLFDILSDPEETHDLADELPDVVRLMQKELPELAEGRQVLELETNARDLGRLRDMGYIGDE